ncbi:primosomal protein N' [Anaerobacillus arseniciselenatis]|uniref:Replication restart protein PriA n=1 Tax=Anaerobacillus arseniciselenatis TaxID=85682 RepID=A0A1S2LC70_9BACI|nr:primosomal protein N' [Anaerobacillus arseniciselenatis]OIJ09850.1 primosomal protein N' [Anaerobacillus arseniciselenatis]
MIVKVVVDVPSGQTDRSFDYEVPPHLEKAIERGMRVIVPFGPRKVQGFVVGISDVTDLNKLKPIEDVLDVTPVLTEELLALGDWLTTSALCFKITAYQAMLPAALRAKYKKEIRLVHKERMNELQDDLKALFQYQSVIDWEELTKGHQQRIPQIKKAITSSILEVIYVVKDKVTYKKVKIVEPNNEQDLLAELKTIDNRAAKQKQVIEYFLKNRQPISVKELIERISTTRSTIKALVEKGILIEREIEVSRDPYADRDFKRTTPLTLTTNQQKIIQPIFDSIHQKEHKTFLIHGVTGSGKTEVYLQSIAEVLKEGKEAIVLVPEISLTPQMVQRFKERFGSLVAVLHSALSKGEKYDEWRKIQQGSVKVVVGARSAIFAPFKNIGIIIIDEEHEATYKQDENPRYHARDVAIKRASAYQCPLILGSATPSLESYARAKKGVYHLLSMLERVNDVKLPTVEIIDMREELKSGNRSMFSQLLYKKLSERLARGEQSVLFLNRRGYSTFVMCRECGYVAECPHCDISLTYHHTSRSLKCHYCGHEEGMPQRCSSCNSEHIRFFGSGTQKVEEEITKVLPGARVIRMDVDTTRKKGAHEKLLTAFSEGKADILLGTQMIAKGLDFPNITLVGVLAADSMLNLPDFRASERTFQLLTQVSGRAGRHQLPGEVVIQTYTPEHYSIDLVRNHDFIAFFEKEMITRRMQGYPPYYYVTVIQVSHEEITKVIEVTGKIAEYVKRSLSNQAIVLGPVVASIPRIKNRYRYQCMIKYKNEPTLVKTLKEITENYKREMNKGDLQVSIDMNPYVLM